ncbi:pentapeptide repeat-containing protein [Paenibacillus daejeonensis]|uniref:pentapeptide repeat-containing protein n=1 Tax=Paenibacillus daejeonensis TaxID=135193 RepID=UPI00035DE828|nr:pentapeptide repeat-containing protein [Paenibacillus daejeonensis]
MNKKQATTRWSPEQTAEFQEQLAAITGKRNLHKKDRAFPSSPFGKTEDGYADFRGVALTEAMEYLTLERVDLSYAQFLDAATLRSSTLSHCLLQGIKLSNRFVTRQFDHCSFRQSNLSQARLGERFVDCDFTSSNLSKTVARDVSFVRCRFNDAKLRGAMLMHCVFEDCSFEGSVLGGGSFYGSRFVGESDALPDWGGTDTIVDGVKLNGVPLAQL